MSKVHALLRLTVLVAAIFNTTASVGNAAVPTATNVGNPVRATIDVPASAAVFTAEGGTSVGGMVTRVELNQPALSTGLSSWYRLAYVDGGTHLRMFENYFETVANPQSDIVESQLAAWRFANELIGSPQAPLPDGASVRTGADFGSSAGLMFALTYLDLLSPGRLVGELRVAGTGGIGPDGRVFPVSHVEVKVAAALLTHPNVVFTPRPSKMIDQATIFESVPTLPYGAGDSVSDWLHLRTYGEAGRQAGHHPGVTAFVVVHDIRQALAWLCGRTGDRQVCALAQRSAALPVPTGRTW